jgi:effector-binding domain-containing protein
MMHLRSYFLSCLVVGMLASCSSDKNVTEEKGTELKMDSATLVPNHLAVKTLEQLTDAKGIIGLFDVPEMLTITKMDSANLPNVAKKIATNFGIVQKDMTFIKAEMNGSAGAIYYNNDTSNFIFECVIPIKEMPKVQPKKSQVVVLEATKMLIYNYYGPYQNLFIAYAEIKSYCDQHKIEQSGPMREFYITDPVAVKDSMQWLTRIMVPVK